MSRTPKLVSFRSRTALLALAVLCSALPSCRRGKVGPPGPAATITPQVADVPTNLRLGTHPAGAPHYRLHWDRATTGSIPIMHAVYATPAGQSGPAPDDIVAAVGPGIDAAEVTLLGDTGTWNLRVTAFSVTGSESAPSAALVIDTTARLLLQLDAGNDGNDGYSPADLYSVLPAANVAPAILNERTGNERVVQFAASPDGRRVAFLSDRDTVDSLDLWVAPIDGSAPATKLSGTLAANASVRAFSWSASGDRIAFTADAVTAGVIEAFVVPADASATRMLVSGTMVAGGGIEENAPAVKWSPDGEHVAYLARQRDSQVVELMVAASVADLVAPFAVSGDLLAGSVVDSFDWSPDGTQLAMIAQRDNPHRELFVVDPTGATAPAARSGAALAGAELRDAKWSPDGTRIAFVADDSASGEQIYVAQAGTTAEPVRLDLADRPGNDVWSFDWSPDATRIAYVAAPNVKSSPELFVASASGGTFGVLVNSDNPRDFRWSPDSTQLAYRAGLYQAELFTTGPGFATSFLVSGTQYSLDVLGYDWSTEGDRLAFGAEVFSLESRAVFVVDRFGNRTPEPIPGTSEYSYFEPTVGFPHLGGR